MKVILTGDVEKLGKAGTVVQVKDGYARNFLFCRGLALPLTEANQKKLQQEKLKKTLELEKAKKLAEEQKERLDGLSLTIVVLTQAEESLYAPVNAQAISGALKEEGFEINKQNILLERPIEALGIYEVEVKLHPEVTAKPKVWIVKK